MFLILYNVSLKSLINISEQHYSSGSFDSFEGLRLILCPFFTRETFYIISRGVFSYRTWDFRFNNFYCLVHSNIPKRESERDKIKNLLGIKICNQVYNYSGIMNYFLGKKLKFCRFAPVCNERTIWTKQNEIRTKGQFRFCTLRPYAAKESPRRFIAFPNRNFYSSYEPAARVRKFSSGYDVKKMKDVWNVGQEIVALQK